ncbi:MAG: divergent polysaccharide deacetylase family protein [Thermanaerothrix sp.]|nr:divergent polysaccharide deacetylase family protein [Thermanaerothrix sp.]
MVRRFLWAALILLAAVFAGSRWRDGVELFDRLWDGETLEAPRDGAQEEREKALPDQHGQGPIKLPSDSDPGSGAVSADGIYVELPRASHGSRKAQKAERWLAIVVDDMGYDLKAARKLASLGLPMTWAIIPGAPHASEVAKVAESKGIPYLVHVPMMALSDRSLRGMVVAPGMGPEEIRERAKEAFDVLPGAVGVNNHRGSAATADRPAMEAFLGALKEQRPGWFFLDSRTNPKSVAFQVALEKGIKAFKNRYFIDAVPGGEERALISAVSGAYRSGGAIAIGHPRPGTIEVLSRLSAGDLSLPEGLELVRLTQVAGEGGGGKR